MLLVVPAPAGADASSLYQGPGPRPGPDILYQPLADAPQLQNTGDWSAPPILVSGASAYRDGEFLYQDYLYDDSGAIGSPAQNDPRFSGNGFSRPTGTYTYPTEHGVREQRRRLRRAARQAARRPRPLSGSRSTRSRTGERPRRHDDRDRRLDPAAAVPPRRQRQRARATFLTVHGSTAELLDAATGLPVGARRRRSAST